MKQKQNYIAPEVEPITLRLEQAITSTSIVGNTRTETIGDVDGEWD